MNLTFWLPAMFFLGIIAMGLCLLFLASFYAVIDVLQYRRWAFPWIVIGKGESIP